MNSHSHITEEPFVKRFHVLINLIVFKIFINLMNYKNLFEGDENICLDCMIKLRALLWKIIEKF